MEALEGIGLSPQEWSVTGLLALVFIAVIFGWLLPRWTVRSLIQDRDDWKKLALDLTATNHDLLQVAKENIEPVKTVAKIMTAAQDRNPEDTG